MESSDSNYELDIDPKLVCRFCLSQSNQLLNIFSNSIVDGYVVFIPEIVSYTLDLAVDANDSLPHKICPDCKKQIIQFYTFKEKSKRIEKSLEGMCKKISEQVIKLESTSLDGDVDEVEIEAVPDEAELIEEDFYTTMEDDYNQIELNMVDMSGDPQSNEIIFHVGVDDETSYVLPPAKKTRLDPLVKSAPKTRSSARLMKKELDIQSIDIEDVDIDEEYSNDEDEVGMLESDGNEESDQFQCVLCMKSFTDRTSYIDHCRKHDFSCARCNRVFPDANELASHEIIHARVSDGTKKEKASYTEYVREDMFCIPCNKRLKSNSQVEQHYKMHDAISVIINYIDFYPCHECTLIFAHEEKLAAHNAEHHPNAESRKEGGNKLATLNMIVDGDDESYIDYQFLEDDRDQDYKDGQYVCGECDLVSPTAREARNHTIVHQTKFRCPINDCGCQYDQLSRLSIHVIHKHINNANLCCLHCNEAFETYDKLQYHMKIDCKEKKYNCHECSKKFFSKKALLTHLKSLSNKKYSCTFCDKTFKQQGELTIHTRSHTNERPFECTICNKSYKTSSMRAAHMDSHIIGKTFECELCQKKLQSRTSYRNHMKRHTEEKKHVCMCGKRFFTKYHLKLHFSKIHDKESKAEKIEYDSLYEDTLDKI